MGKRQRLRREQREAARDRGQTDAYRTRGTHWGWLLAVIVLVGVIGAAIVIVVRANQARFLAFGLQANVQQARNALEKNQGKFTLADGERLRRILSDVEQVAREQKNLDRQSGGNLLFFVEVVKEMAEGPALQAGELDRMEALLAETRRQLQRRKLSP